MGLVTQLNSDLFKMLMKAIQLLFQISILPYNWMLIKIMIIINNIFTFHKEISVNLIKQD